MIKKRVHKEMHQNLKLHENSNSKRPHLSTVTDSGFRATNNLGFSFTVTLYLSDQHLLQLKARPTDQIMPSNWFDHPCHRANKAALAVIISKTIFLLYYFSGSLLKGPTGTTLAQSLLPLLISIPCS